MVWKKFAVLLISFLFFLSVHLNVSWKLCVNDVNLPGRYSSGQIKECSRISALAAEEISPEAEKMPILRKRLYLSFKPQQADSRLLNDYLLLYSSGVELKEGVYVNGSLLGTVESGSVLCESLRSYIENQMPHAAVFGSISGKLQLRPVFTSPGHCTNYDDMVLLISGMAPVFYVDKDGHLA